MFMRDYEKNRSEKERGLPVVALLYAIFIITGKRSWTLSSIGIDAGIQLLVPVQSYLVAFSKLCFPKFFYQ